MAAAQGHYYFRHHRGKGRLGVEFRAACPMWQLLRRHPLAATTGAHQAASLPCANCSSRPPAPPLCSLPPPCSKKSKKRDTGVRYTDVAGIDAIKEDINEILDILLGREEYKEMGAQPIRVSARQEGAGAERW